MTQINSAAIRLFLLGTIFWCAPGAIPPFELGWLVSEARSVVSWLGSIAATVCFFMAYRKAVHDGGRAP